MQFKPLHDNLLVKRVEQAERTAGGIIIPDSAQEKPMEGEVLAAGPGRRLDDGRLEALDVAVGDRVLFGKWSGTEIRIEGQDYVILKESDVLGVIEPAAGARRAA